MGSQLKTVIPSLLGSVSRSEVVPLELFPGGAAAKVRVQGQNPSPCGTTLRWSHAEPVSVQTPKA